MTRAEFNDNVNDFGELISICCDYGLEYIDCIYDSYDRDSEIAEDLDDLLRDINYEWWRLRDILNDIPTGYDYYRKISGSEWTPLDDQDFEDIKADVRDWLESTGNFDDADEEDDYEEDDNEQDDEFDVDEPFSLRFLYEQCTKDLNTEDIIIDPSEDDIITKIFEGKVISL